MDRDKFAGVLDLKIALSHVDGDSDLLSELAAIFVQDYPRLIEEARDSILKNDCSGFERAAHTLKGRLAFFGITKLRDQLLSLERMGRDRDMTRAAEGLAEIENEMEHVLAEFKSLIPEQSP
jgi:HPt (histidine-containing phosphotransfer) domain-containing protein